VDLAQLLDSAVAIHFADMTDVIIRREYEPLDLLTLDRHKLIQILGNLLSNARHALKDRGDTRRELTLRIRRQNSDAVAIEIQDSGVGIAADVLGRLFEFGFTTKRDGHGFGLHTSAILAQELSGELVAFSDGLGCGARFVLRLPTDTVALRKQA
jgi:two-component system sensor kinase FixL